MTTDKILWPDTPFKLDEHLILVGRRGSEAHGTYIPSEDPTSIDDRDLMGIVVPPAKYYIGLSKWEHAESIKECWDVVLYEYRKFIGLLLNQNPNVLGMLWLEEEDYLLTSKQSKVLIANRNLFRERRKAASSFMGYATSQLYKMEHMAFKGYMGDKRKKLVEKHGYDCYEAATTEFLTNRGWKFFDDVTDSDLLATVGISSGDLEFQAPTSRTDRLYSGQMFTIEPYSSKAVVTENHNLLVSQMHRNPKNGFSNAYTSEGAEWQLKSPLELQESRRSHFHIRRAPTPRVSEQNVSDDYLRLAGMFLSDGTLEFRGDSVKSVRLTQSKPGRYNLMADSLMSVYPTRKYVYKKETIWIAHGAVAREIFSDFGHAKGKHLPEWCFHLSARQAEILWDAWMAGDGTSKASTDIVYTASKRLADDLQAVLISAGIPATVYGPYEFETKHGTPSMYHVARSNTSSSIHALYFKRQCRVGEATPKEGYPVKVRDVENERVVCFEVPNGTLITRNSGKVAIHGNCKNGAHLIRLLHMGIEFLTTGELHVRRTWDRDMLIDIKKGKWTLDEVKKYAQDRMEACREAELKSDLPEHIDTEAVEAIVLDTISEIIR